MVAPRRDEGNRGGNCNRPFGPAPRAPLSPVRARELAHGRYRPRSWLSGRRHLPALDPAVRRLQDREREAYSLLERGLGEALAHRRRTARLVGTEAEQAERRDHLLGGGSSARLRLDVVKLEPRARRAAAPALAHEGASSLVALPHPALNVSRDVARVGA